MTTTTTSTTIDDNRTGQLPRSVRFLNPMTFRLARLRGNGPWYRTDPNPTTLANIASAIMQDTRVVGNIVQQTQAPPPPPPPPAPVSPDVVIYEPYSNTQNASTVHGNDGDSSQANDAAAFNNSANGGLIDNAHAHAQAQAQSQTQAQVQAQTQTQAQARHGSRCPYYRRLSASGYHGIPSYYHPNLQPGAPYLRPAYAPHESLWYRQQNNQEIHRRHMSSGANASNDNPVSSSFGALPYPRSAATGDQQHPIGHTHRRMTRQYVCGLNLVRKIEIYTIQKMKMFFTKLTHFYSYSQNSENPPPLIAMR